MQMMYYTLLSGIITFCFDIGVLFIAAQIMNGIGAVSNMPNAEAEALTESFGNGMRSVPQMPYAASDITKHISGFEIFGQTFHWTIILFLVIFSCFIFILLFHFMTQKMTNYIGELTTSIQQIAQGDFSTKVEVRYDNELSIIARNLNIMTDELAMLKEKDQEAESAKNELITNVAHDLRTPLTSIIGYLGILNSDPQLEPSIRQKYTQVAYDKAKRLEKLINDLFSFTKLSYGNMPLNLAKIDLVKLLEQQADEFYPSFEENQLTCEFRPHISSAYIMADGELIARAFENLITNAIKYGKDGKLVRISIDKCADEFKVTVLNYGTIIPQEDIPFIFDRFYRVEQSRQESTGGTGLGLPITKSIIEKHEGHMDVTSSINGTEFNVYLKKC